MGVHNKVLYFSGLSECFRNEIQGNVHIHHMMAIKVGTKKEKQSEDHKDN